MPNETNPSYGEDGNHYGYPPFVAPNSTQPVHTSTGFDSGRRHTATPQYAAFPPTYNSTTHVPSFQAAMENGQFYHAPASAFSYSDRQIGTIVQVSHARNHTVHEASKAPAQYSHNPALPNDSSTPVRRPTTYLAAPNADAFHAHSVGQGDVQPSRRSQNGYPSSSNTRELRNQSRMDTVYGDGVNFQARPLSTGSNDAQIPDPSNDNTLRLPCPDCDNVYTGNWAHRNRSRHMETKHARITLQCAVCDKSFNRQDARLKHERDRHPELKRAPATPRRKRSDESNQGGISPGALNLE